jgi:hypothetical protein
MNESLTAYLWQAAYNAAVLETDNSRMALRIYEAIAAIEQRLLSPVEPGSEEQRALKDAQVGISALRVERIRQGQLRVRRGGRHT